MTLTRRNFNRRLALAAGASLPMVRDAGMHAATPQDQLDQYGGWRGKRFDATGFFRIEKDDRWWIVTPDGAAFLSFGVNHLHAGWWNRDHNREAWRKRWGIESMEEDVFKPALRTWFLKTCTEYGFNTAGVHTSLDVINKPRPAIPYMRPIHFVDIAHWKDEMPDFNFRDVFADEHVMHCDRLAKKLAWPVRDDPFLLGYSMTDCPLFTEEDCRERPDTVSGGRRAARIGWPRRLRNLGGGAAGKHAYVDTMREIYRDSIGDFNTTYNTNFGSFAALASAENWRHDTDLYNSNESRDNTEFLKRVVAQYYKTGRDAIRRYDTNHLFFGDKINANTDAMDTILPVTSQFTDVVMYQMYGRYEVQKPGLDRWSKVVDKPILNGDSAFTMITEHTPRPYGPVADNESQRAQWTVEFFQQAFARPEFVGWHYCGIINNSNLGSTAPARQHTGMFDGVGVPYSLVTEAIKDCGRLLYDVSTRA